MDFPANPPLPLFVHTYSRWSVIEEIRQITTSAPALGAGLTWVGANTAYYMPVFLPWAYPVGRVFWINGSSVTTVNMDFGIYTADGTLKYSTGSTAESGASSVQYTTPSGQLLLTPGPYYFALACSSTVASRGGLGSVAPTAAQLRQVGVLQQASALPLPATATFATMAAAIYPICGVTRTTTGF